MRSMRASISSSSKNSPRSTAAIPLSTEARNLGLVVQIAEQDIFRQSLGVDPGFFAIWASWASCSGVSCTSIACSVPKNLVRASLNLSTQAGAINWSLQSMKAQYLLILCATALYAGPLDDTLATGRKALANDGVATAWRLAQKALADAPESAAAHEFAGEVRFRRGEFADADAEFKSAVEWNPRDAQAWYGLGRVAECASMNKTAVEDFHRAYELNPNDQRILAAWISRLTGQERIDA